jgi:hypothetical protein
LSPCQTKPSLHAASQSKPTRHEAKWRRLKEKEEKPVEKKFLERRTWTCRQAKPNQTFLPQHKMAPSPRPEVKTSSRRAVS